MYHFIHQVVIVSAWTKDTIDHAVSGYGTIVDQTVNSLVYQEYPTNVSLNRASKWQMWFESELMGLVNQQSSVLLHTHPMQCPNTGKLL